MGCIAAVLSQPTRESEPASCSGVEFVPKHACNTYHATRLERSGHNLAQNARPPRCAFAIKRHQESAARRRRRRALGAAHHTATRARTYHRTPTLRNKTAQCRRAGMRQRALVTAAQLWP